MISIGPGAESVRIELWAAGASGGRWDEATWDGSTWSAPGWRDVGCDVAEATYKWGASQESGILSVAEAGELDLVTIDPARHLDPLNASSAFYGAVKPGTPIRIVGEAPGDHVASTGWIDEASYSLGAGTGRIRAIDAIAYLSQVQYPEGVAMPNTLRERVRWIVQTVGLGPVIPVEGELPDPDVDPPVAPFDGKSAPAWALISSAALDALVYVWADPTGMIRFRSWGSFPDAPLSIGCPPPDADPGEMWLEGIAELEHKASADAIRNSVRAESSAGVFAPAIVDAVSVNKYGPRPFDVQRVVPDRATWAGRILADRADAGLEIAVGELRPYTIEELAALLSMRLAGPSIVRIRDDAHGEIIDLDLGTIGSTVGITPAGWRWRLVTMLSRVEWDAIDPEPEPPPIDPTPPPFHTETRTYIASSDALLALTSGGAKYGAGASNSLPFGTWSGWTYRSLLAFPSIPWANVKAVKTATLKLTTSTQVRVGFGSSPKSQVRRITGTWSAGSSSSPSSGNAVVWPGPTTTTSGSVTGSFGTAQSTQKSVRVDAIARAWAPASAGGSGAAQRGIALYEYSSSGGNTGEVWPVEQGGAARPTLELVLEVYD
jgi:hypothetical protein